MPRGAWCQAGHGPTMASALTPAPDPQSVPCQDPLTGTPWARKQVRGPPSEGPLHPGLLHPLGEQTPVTSPLRGLLTPESQVSIRGGRHHTLKATLGPRTISAPAKCPVQRGGPMPGLGHIPVCGGSTVPSHGSALALSSSRPDEGGTAPKAGSRTAPTAGWEPKGPYGPVLPTR